jgi:hypothetical protein
MAVGASAAQAATNAVPVVPKASVPAVPMNPAGEGKPTDAGAKSGGRHGDYTRKAAQGPHAKVVAATFFGSEGYEEFVDAGGLPDGTVVAFGNAWGPAFPKKPEPVVLGRGRHSGLPAVRKQGKGAPSPDYNCPDSAGMMVFFAENLSAVTRIARMDWGVGNIRAGLIVDNGRGLVVAGQCHAAFATFSGGCGKVNVMPFQPPPPDPRKKAAVPAARPDVYIARFAADTLKPLWIWVLEKNGNPPDNIYADKAGAIYFDAGGLRRISADGAEMKTANPKANTGTAKWLGVDQSDGGVFYGGDRNTSTGQEPYRQPYMYKFDTEGKKIVTLWEPDPKTVGSATGGLMSDSSPRAMAWSKTGELLVAGWSDGGNSVFPRQALDWHKPAAGGGMGMQTWGMKNANSLGHIMRIDPKTWETKAHTWWAAFIPSWFSSPGNRGAPNFVNIGQIAVLGDGSVGVVGSAATGLIQTPNGFWVDPVDGAKYGGAYVALFLPDLANLLFSSYLPGYESASLGVTRKGAVVVGRSAGVDADPVRPTMSPVKNAVQKEFMGNTDAHIIALELPQFPR